MKKKFDIDQNFRKKNKETLSSVNQFIDSLTINLSLPQVPDHPQLDSKSLHKKGIERLTLFTNEMKRQGLTEASTGFDMTKRYLTSEVARDTPHLPNLNDSLDMNPLEFNEDLENSPDATLRRRQSVLRSKKIELTSRMEVLQTSLDIGKEEGRRKGTANFLVTQSLDMNPNKTFFSHRSNMSRQVGSPDSMRTSFQPPMIDSSMRRSRDYYMKYIHHENLRRLEAQKKTYSKFIPKSDTENKTYNQKFKHYMRQLSIEEKIEQKEQRKEQHKKKKEISKASTQFLAQLGIVKPKEPSPKILKNIEVEEIEESPKAKRLESKQKKVGSVQFTNFSQKAQSTVAADSPGKHTSPTKHDRHERHDKPRDSLKQPNADIDLGSLEKRTRQFERRSSIMSGGTSSFREGQSSQERGPHARFIFRKTPQLPSSQKKLEELMSELSRNLKTKISKDHFVLVAGEQFRLSKQKFKVYLTSKYGNAMAEKLQAVIDFNGPVDFQTFCSQIEQIIKERTMLLQVAFDIFDSNSDDKISELDIFKLFFQFNQFPNADSFQDIFYKDICQMSKQFNKAWSSKLKQILKDHSQDELYVMRLLHFRNLQVLDKNFDKKKQKVLWPLFTFKSQSQVEHKIGSRKFGFNPKLFKNIESVRNQNSLAPIQPLKDRYRSKKQDSDDDDQDSEDEWKNQDFFESGTFYQFLRSSKNGLNLKDAKELKEKRKQLMTVNSQQNSYLVAKQNRKVSNFKKLKPILGGTYPANLSTHIFENPLFEQYVTSYMEETQADISELISLEQFKTITWEFGVPRFIIDFLEYLTGLGPELKQFFIQARYLLHKVTLEEQERCLVNQQHQTHDVELEEFVRLEEKYRSIQNNNLDRRDSQETNYDHLDQNQQGIDKQIKDLKMQLDEKLYKQYVKVFKKMVANPCDPKHEVKQLAQYYCTENSIRSNFERVFGTPCDIFAKILYINMAQGKDHARIDFPKFVRVFDGLLEDVQKKRNRAIFNLLDVKKTGQLDIVFLMQILNNVDKNTHFAQEILTIVREYKSKNILLTAGFSRQITLNFQTFNDLVPNSCLIEELQYILCNRYVPEKNKQVVHDQLKKKLSVMFGVGDTPQDSTRQASGDRERVLPESDHEEEPGQPTFLRKQEKLAPPDKSPFEVIPNLDQHNLHKLYLNKNNKHLLPEGSEVEADKMMTKHQYQTLFKQFNDKDSSIILQKFK